MIATKDPWTQVLNQFYDLNRVTIKLSSFGKKWKISISGFNEKIFDWVDDTLIHWNNVVNITTDCWVFENHKDAEKFITLFNLRWA